MYIYLRNIFNQQRSEMAANKLFVLFCMLFILTACGTNDKVKDRFKSDIIEYLDAYNKTDWEKVTSMIYPGFFSAVSRNRIIQTLKTLDSTGMKRTFTFKYIDKISDVIKEGDRQYCRINYSIDLRALINGNQIGNIEKFKEDFEEDYGKENVVYDDKLFQFTIKARQSVIAVANTGSENWKYMELNNEHALDLVSLAVPKNVFDKLKE